MTKFNVQSFLFAFIVLIFAVMGRRGSHDASLVTSPHIVSRTSLAEASVPFMAESEHLESPHSRAVPESAEAAVEGLPRKSKVPFIDLGISAKSILIQELNVTTPLYASGERERWPLASITKLVSALVARDMFDAETLIGITREAVETPGTSGFFKEGEIFTTHDLIKAALGISSNDAAEALARGAGYNTFIEAMQKKAEHIGMVRTSFFDPTGLSSLNLSTAEDLEKLTSYILKEAPDLFLITRTPNIFITEQTTGKGRLIQNNNLFAGEPWFVGGKTGYTDDAQGNLLSIVSYGNRRFMVVILGSTDRYEETKKTLEWIQSYYL
jgi:D-alanyl-D-alanine endopeptidase (penicillin-binding protein 7)